MGNTGLAYLGKIISIDSISGADMIVSATVVCGAGGKWKGVVQKSKFEVGCACVVYLPDAILPPLESFEFMKKTNYRVKMQTFRKSPSEVVIMPTDLCLDVGTDVTELMGVNRYLKPTSIHLSGIACGDFPSFIPKTDELHYQKVPELIAQLTGQPYYITEKMDGSSTTAYCYKNKFGVCSRNLELMRNPDNGYWKVAAKHNLENQLPENISLQWETCGPSIQGNPHALKDIQGFAFSAYNIKEKRYLEMDEFWCLTNDIQFPDCELVKMGEEFSAEMINDYLSMSKKKEGVVIRSQTNLLGDRPISFKVINLEYGNN